MWKSIVEVQLFFLAETTTATVQGNGYIQYTEGNESHREKLRIPDATGSTVEIDYLSGVGPARLHGKRNRTPIVVLLVAILICLILVAPVIREAREFANKANSHTPSR